MSTIPKIEELCAHLGEKPDDLDDVMVRVRDAFSAKHAIYHSARLGAKAVDDPVIHLTYSPQWVKQYLSKGYMRVDPVIREGFRRAAPFQWSDVEPVNDDEIAFFMDAAGHDVGQSGLSIPVRDRTGRRALFTLSSDKVGPEWELWVRTYLSSAVDVAHMVHKLSVDRQLGETKMATLTSRERQALYWTAQGKTASETGIILGLSESTVATYLRSARYKLNASTVAQAVYKAEKAGLLSANPDDFVTPD